MKISTKGKYALNMLLYLAEHENSGFISLKEIAQKRNMSKKYLEQIVPVLNKGNILQTSRGFQGGYKLAQSPDKCTIGMILRLTEGSLSEAAASEQAYNQNQSDLEYGVFFVLQGLNKTINEYLDSITLQDILDNQRELYSNDYII